MAKRRGMVGMPARKMTPEVQQRARMEMELQQKNRMVREMQAQQEKKITSKVVSEASQILRKYKEGKANLENKIIQNEQFWKLRQWQQSQEGKDWMPTTAWLWSCIESRYADVMDSYPTCNLQPRQMDDKTEAKKLSAIIPVILEQNRYEETYSQVARYTLKNGGGVQGIFWDGSKHNGLGDISIRKIDFINLFWEPGITDIQQSENLFHTELVSNKILEQRYPQCVGHLGGKNITLATYLFDDTVDTSGKSVVVDWYYHTEYNGKRVLQYVKYVNDVVLYATENETQKPVKEIPDPETGMVLETPAGASMAERGLYDHGLYPFVVQPLFPIEGSICGYGYTDIGRDTQLAIDELNKSLLENAKAGATPRYFSKNDGSVNEEEYTDLSKKIVHVAGSVDETHIRPIDNCQLPGIYVELYNAKIDELKYVTSNQDSNNGVAPSGVTAASAIAALQETAGKNARSSNKTFHRAYREVIYQVIELIRQFYDIPRTFRIAPDQAGGEERFVQYSNAGIKEQAMNTMGTATGYRLPEFDIEVSTEKANPYKKMEMNELALSFYNQGFFNPQMADQAIACLQMMDFAKKDEIIQKIQSNGTMYQMLVQYQQLALQLAQQVNPRLAEAIGQQILQQGGQPIPQGGMVSLETEGAEHPYVEQSREQARASTQAD
ncbi:MAG: hypothetical protein J6K15_06290 [Lachnospiraceae bacterium]|nr:hypothetical protein [Lachnospiraceae bacterium]